MSQPKKKTSRGRRNQRRWSGGNRMDAPTYVTCPNCSDLTRPHTVCACGYYGKKFVLTVPVVEATPEK